VLKVSTESGLKHMEQFRAESTENPK